MIEQARGGDLEAFDRLIRRYEDQVYSVAYRLLGNEDDAADVTQEVFIAFYRHLHRFRGEAKLSTWLHRITTNAVKNFWNRQKRQRVYQTQSLDIADDPDDPPPIEMMADSRPDPRREAAGLELVDIVERKLQQLDPEFREVVVLRFIEGLSYEEVAAATKEPLGTVKSRIYRARRMLRELMADYLVEVREVEYAD
jgi:RNA polymerase sigma-70 factor (ECF subfamily)